MAETMIWKYPIFRPANTYGEIEVTIAKGAEILSCQIQNNEIYLWVLVEDKPMIDLERRAFHIVGTGHKFEYNGRGMKFISTVQQPPFVWHIFEEVNVSQD